MNDEFKHFNACQIDNHTGTKGRTNREPEVAGVHIQKAW
jgi:hypothetical protein